jgi:hypothetical protein
MFFFGDEETWRLLEEAAGLVMTKKKMRDEFSFLERRFIFNGVMDGPLFLACICSLFSGTSCPSCDFVFSF